MTHGSADQPHDVPWVHLVEPTVAENIIKTYKKLISQLWAVAASYCNA